MKRRESTKAAAGEPAWYASAARPSTPGELTKVTPAELAETEADGLASAESEESAESSKNKAKLRWLSGFQAAIAAFFLLLGEEWYAMFLAASALYNAIEGETRWRVPKFVKVCVTILSIAASILMFVMVILKVRGH